jgi:hypothetical protein
MKLTSKYSPKSYIPVSVFCLFFLSSIFYILNPVRVSAATLSLSPSSGTYAVGSSISVSVLVSSTDKTMNAASGLISFPTDLLSVSSISKSGSIVDFWAQDPSYSNTSGTVNFESVLLPPGFTGSSGKIITIIFRTKAEGVANLNFTSGSVLAADGAGTEILTSSGVASFNISPTKNEPVITTPTASGVPQPPGITSGTHPDETKWYALSDADFSWTLPKGVVTVAVLIGRNATSSPNVFYKPAISSKQVTNLEDGVWYFHVQFKNNIGWSKVSDFKLQIDTEKPTSFDITEVKRSDPTDPKAKFIFDAVDKTSGIDHYEVQIDGGPVEIWKDDGSKVYQTQSQESGAHTILVKAVDKAGNFLTNSAQFNIKSPAFNFPMVFIPLIALVLLLILLLWYAWRRFFLIGRKVRDTEDAIHKAFDLLKESVQEQIKKLEKIKNKRQLTREEEEINAELKKDLEDAESYIRKEIKEIDHLINKK